jgi:hypothetical protein
VLEGILDHAKGYAPAIESLVITAKEDWRNLFLPSADKDPNRVLEKLIKNLRFTKVFTDDEVSTLRGPYGGVEPAAFESIIRIIKQADKRITGEQQCRIIQIGALLGTPAHMFDWLKSFVREEAAARAENLHRPWWRFWR